MAAAYACPEPPTPPRLVLPVDIWARASAACVDAVAPALARVQAHLGPGAPVVLAPDGLDQWREAFRVCQAGEIWEALGGWVTQNTPDFGPGIRERFQMAAAIEADTRAAAEAVKTTARARMAEVVGEDAVLVYPTVPDPAPFTTADGATLDAFRQRAFDMLCPAGLAGLPQLSIPAGTVDQGPVGLSLVGAPRRDRALIALAAEALEGPSS